MKPPINTNKAGSLPYSSWTGSMIIQRLLFRARSLFLSFSLLRMLIKNGICHLSVPTAFHDLTGLKWLLTYSK